MASILEIAIWTLLQLRHQYFTNSPGWFLFQIIAGNLEGCWTWSHHFCGQRNQISDEQQEVQHQSPSRSVAINSFGDNDMSAVYQRIMACIIFVCASHIFLMTGLGGYLHWISGTWIIESIVYIIFISFLTCHDITNTYSLYCNKGMGAISFQFVSGFQCEWSKCQGYRINIICTLNACGNRSILIVIIQKSRSYGHIYMKIYSWQ